MSPMTDAELHERLRTNLLAFKRFQGRTAALHVHTLPGVVAFAVPGCTELLLQQQIMFDTPTALAEALGPLERWYHALAVPAWRVPVLPGDPATEALLGRAGYTPGALQPAMSLALHHAAPPEPPPGITLERSDDLAAVLDLNARCYGPAITSFLEAWRSPPQPGPPLYAMVVREGERALACGLSFEQGDTAGIYLVATHEQARRRGLGALVMRGLHADAHARGRTLAVLQSTPLGEGLYRHLGYRHLGGWTSWIKHAPGAAPA